MFKIYQNNKQVFPYDDIFKPENIILDNGIEKITLNIDTNGAINPFIGVASLTYGLGVEIFKDRVGAKTFYSHNPQDLNENDIDALFHAYAPKWHNNFLFKVRAGENGEFKYEFLKDGVFRTNLKGASMIGLEDGLNEIQLSRLFRITNPNQKLITPLFRLICVWGEMHENWELIPFSIDLPVSSNTLILTKE